MAANRDLTRQAASEALGFSSSPCRMIGQGPGACQKLPRPIRHWGLPRHSIRQDVRRWSNQVTTCGPVKPAVDERPSHALLTGPDTSRATGPSLLHNKLPVEFAAS
ncbi:hypothetical protein ACQKWADRAFT_107686 [Trichoderma austrokoningii]